MIWHTIEQAAERVHRDPETIRRWIRQGLTYRTEPVTGRRYVEDEALMAAERGARMQRRQSWFTSERQPDREAS
jgi:predicted site-specific integrase-resolvase